MNDSCCFLLLKNEAVNKRHLTRNFDVTRFCCHIDLKHTSSREEGVKIIRFSGGRGVIYGWPLITLSKNVRELTSLTLLFYGTAISQINIISMKIFLNVYIIFFSNTKILVI